MRIPEAYRTPAATAGATLAEVNQDTQKPVRRVSGTAVVASILGMVAVVAGGLVWYKNQPQRLPPALNSETGVMLLIPAGPFRHGPEGTAEGVAPAFYMDRIEVTNSAWMRFCTATGRDLPPGFPLDRPGDPVVNITIEDAATFAKWAGKRLPDALEWEKAYRGSDGRTYPWGKTETPERANVSDHPRPRGSVVPADSMPESASPYNLLHMAGNVAEFVRTVQRPTPADIEEMSRRVQPAPSAKEAWYGVRGGSFEQPLVTARPWLSKAVPLSFRSPSVGFRCVKDPPRR